MTAISATVLDFGAPRDNFGFADSKTSSSDSRLKQWITNSVESKISSQVNRVVAVSREIVTLARSKVVKLVSESKIDPQTLAGCKLYVGRILSEVTENLNEKSGAVPLMSAHCATCYLELTDVRPIDEWLDGSGVAGSHSHDEISYDSESGGVSQWFGKRLRLTGLKEAATRVGACIYPGVIVGVIGGIDNLFEVNSSAALPVLKVNELIRHDVKVEDQALRTAPSSQSSGQRTWFVSGPYYSNDEVYDNSLLGLLGDAVTKSKPELLVVSGPFASDKHPVNANNGVESDGTINSFESIYEGAVFQLKHLSRKCTAAGTRLVVIPSPEDVVSIDSLPQQPIPFADLPNIQLASNPCAISLSTNSAAGLVLVTSIDPFASLNSSMAYFSYPEGVSRVDACLSQLLSMKSLLPMAIDIPNARVNSKASSSGVTYSSRTPDAIVFSSVLGKKFSKLINGVHVLNSGRSVDSKAPIQISELSCAPSEDGGLVWTSEIRSVA